MLTRPSGKVRAIALAIVIGLVAAMAAPAAKAQQSQWSIWVMKVDGSQARKLAQVDGCAGHSCPRWSRDGKRVAFQADDSATRAPGVYIVNADGSGLTKIDETAHPDWSPDDKQIASDRYLPPGGREVFVENADGQGRIQVATGISPRWSPDGGHLAVTDLKNVQIIDLVTGEERALFDSTFAGLMSGYAWTRDGKRLAVVVRPDAGGKRHLLLVDSEGEAKGMTLRLQGGMGGFVSFSPDGKKLALSDDWKVRIVDVEGPGRPRIVPGQQGKNKNPDWSPDGQWIVFSSDRSAP